MDSPSLFGSDNESNSAIPSVSAGASVSESPNVNGGVSGTDSAVATADTNGDNDIDVNEIPEQTANNAQSVLEQPIEALNSADNDENEEEDVGDQENNNLFGEDDKSEAVSESYDAEDDDNSTQFTKDDAEVEIPSSKEDEASEEKPILVEEGKEEDAVDGNQSLKQEDHVEETSVKSDTPKEERIDEDIEMSDDAVNDTHSKKEADAKAEDDSSIPRNDQDVHVSKEEQSSQVQYSQNNNPRLAHVPTNTQGNETPSEKNDQNEEDDDDDEDDDDEASMSLDKAMLREDSQDNDSKLDLKQVESTENDPKILAIPQSHEIVIPSYAKWLNLMKIHSIERQSLPEFFTNRIPSKTPQVYVKYRNFMINAYRLNPNEYFSVTTARRNICGDAAAIFRIHKFLMKWGLINYQVDAKILPKNVEPPFTGEYSTRHDAPRGLFPFESYKPSVQLPDMAKLKRMMDTNDNTSALHKYLNERKRKMNGIPGTPTSTIDVVKQEKLDEEDDEKAVEKEIESEEHASTVKRPKILENSNSNDDWEKEDIQRLLKGIQEHGSDWYKIAKGVRTKSPEQCILKFLQLPIEDKFLHQNTNSDLGPLKYAPHLPFSKSENPVMSTIAFLVGLVDPEMVKKMTNRALKTVEDTENENLNQNDAKEGSEIAVASLGVRSHVFATSEERQMNAIAHELVEVQLKKVEIKLNLLTKIEKALELEKKAIQRQQEDVLVQRLALAKHSNSVYQKLQQSLELFDDKDKLISHISEIKDLLSNPPKLSIGAAFGASAMNSSSPASNQKDTTRSENDVKPVSIEAPQFYRYWSA